MSIKQQSAPKAEIQMENALTKAPRKSASAKSPATFLSVAEIRKQFEGYVAPEDVIVRGQLRQDLLAFIVAGQKRDGYFVEFAATDGEK
jgi:hypothetical protein